MAEGAGELRMGVACSAFVVIGAVEAALGVLVPSLLDAFALGTGSVTLLLASQMGGYGLAALLNGVGSGRLGLDHILMVAFTLLAATLLLYSLTPRWDLMVATGVAMGLGIGLIDAGLNTAVAQHEAGARLIGPLHGFYGGGAVLGPAIATTVLALGGGWRLVYVVLAGLSGLVLLLVRRQPRTGPWQRTPGTGGGGDWRVLGEALRQPAVGLSALVLLAAVGIEASIGTWGFSVQHLARSQTAVAAGIGTSLYWLGLTAGRFCFGGLVGRLPMPLVPAAVVFATSAASAGAVIGPTSVGWSAAAVGLAAVPALLVPVVLGLAGLHLFLLPRHG